MRPARLWRLFLLVHQPGGFRHRRGFLDVHARVNPVSGAVALGTLLAAVTLPVVVWVVAR
ncbi:hypothetical protein GWG67_15975 [Bradyrhizobium sp. CSS354]|nr:hypothetical protein [Bradyrhizobium sp. CSS354]